MAELSDAIPESMNRVFTGVIDDTMNDGEVLVVTIASGFTKYNKLFLQIDGKAEDRYQKFFEDMAAMFKAPGLIELTDEELLPFKELTGSVYMGEAEAAGGECHCQCYETSHLHVLLVRGCQGSSCSYYGKQRNCGHEHGKRGSFCYSRSC